MLDSLRKLEKRILKEVSFTYKRYLYNEIDFNSSMIGIVGARGVGKTTILLQYLKYLKDNFEINKSLYFSYDYPTNVDIKLIDLVVEYTQCFVQASRLAWYSVLLI